MDLRVDFSDLKRFAADCKRADPLLAKDFLASLAVAAEPVAAKARRNANAFPGQNRTTRIADSVKVRHRGTRVSVQAGGNGAPEAAPIENHGQSGSFRHPTPTGAWVSQPAHPFLTPAAEESMDDV